METNRSLQQPKIIICNMAGTQVRELNLSQTSANISGLPCGTYTVKFTGSDGNLLSNKLVILR